MNDELTPAQRLKIADAEKAIRDMVEKRNAYEVAEHRRRVELETRLMGVLNDFRTHRPDRSNEDECHRHQVVVDELEKLYAYYRTWVGYQGR